MDRPLRLGTRASRLALWQATWTAEQLQGLGVEVEIVEITTSGDTERRPLTEVGGEGLFTKRIQEALLENEIDLAVHSLKDLPTQSVPELKLVAVPPREEVSDVLVTEFGAPLDELPQGARVGTGSLRRQAQLLHVRPDLKVEPIRGNVETRLSKLSEGEFDAIVLASAGIKRLGLENVGGWLIPLELMLPAVGQAALGLEIRRDDQVTEAKVRPLNESATELAVTAERSLLRNLRAGCLAPVGALGLCDSSHLKLSACVLDPAGVERLFHVAELSGTNLTLDDADAMGHELADQLLAQGASELIHDSRRS